MVVRARLSPPPPDRPQWRWHQAKWTGMPLSTLARGERRLEAENYLSSGFGIRTAIEARRTGWVRLEHLARVRQPPRLKGILVSPEFGVPYLAPTQVFDLRPAPRKWLSLERTKQADELFVHDGMIVVTRSGNVGRTTLAYAPHLHTLISDDLLRVELRDSSRWGWLYSYLRASNARAMMTASRYGHVVKHLEIGHLSSLPVPEVNESISADFMRRVSRILALRNEAHRLATEADDMFASSVGPINGEFAEESFRVSAARLSAGRRRLEASYHTPQADAILRLFKRHERLGDITRRVWWMSRFKRFYGEGGIPYLSADELFTVNPTDTKQILVDPDDNHRDYFVESGWLVMACSGQVYGLNGAVALMTAYHENVFFSHDLIRIVPNDDRVRAGYLLVALTHRTHGRPLLIRAAYGTSIPHLDPNDVVDFPVVRLGGSTENAIADLADASARARAEADAMERDVAAEAERIIDRFLAGHIG